MAKIVNQERQEKMFRLVTQWQTGTLTKKVFCKESNISTYTFDYWLQKYRKSQSDFFELKIPEQPVISEQTVKFEFPSGISAKFPVSAASDLIYRIITKG